jgi:Amt family ammonium transporter
MKGHGGREAGVGGNCMFLDGTIYSDASAAWVLIAAIIVFFMKAGFMLLESAFAREPSDRRNVIVIKHIDAFASAFGFFVVGCDLITYYSIGYPVHRKFYNVQQPLLWFFKFTFASNAATLLGGCLIDFEYKLRLPAAFISAFVISGIVHPFIAWLMWSNHPRSLSPYRYCQYPWSTSPDLNSSNFPCDSPLHEYFAVDFAGGGAVHLLGGTAGLVVCLFAKFEKWRRDKFKRGCCRRQEEELVQDNGSNSSGQDVPMEKEDKKNFLEFMYTVDNASNIEHAALGVLILWFAWFAFNCGSTENISGGKHGYWHSVPSRIAVNMIMCCASGGTLAVIIASWAQLRIRSSSLNANEIANGVLSCLVAITAPCPFVTYYQSCIIGLLAVVFYHLGTFAEYKLKIPDTARVVPVHAVSGLLSVLVASLAALTEENKCYLHATYEGNVFCQLILPDIDFFKLFASQLLAALAMIAAGLSMGLVYGVLYAIPMECLEPIIKILICKRGKLGYSGNLLFTHASEHDKVIANEVLEGERRITYAEITDHLEATQSRSVPAQKWRNYRSSEGQTSPGMRGHSAPQPRRRDYGSTHGAGQIPYIEINSNPDEREDI